MYCECLHSWCGRDLHWQSLKTQNSKNWWQSPDSAQELCSHQNLHVYNFGTQAERWMPRIITVRQFPPSESFSNRVIFESPEMLSFHLFPTCFLLLCFLCFLCFLCLFLCSLSFRSDLLESGITQPLLVAEWTCYKHRAHVPQKSSKSRKIPANF